jgi:hypothetical protein
MTNKEIKQYNKDLRGLIDRLNSRKSYSPLNADELQNAYDEVKKLHEEFQLLAEKVRASRCIGTGIVQLLKFPVAVDPTASMVNRISSLEAIITELIFGINNALQTESMLNSTASAKWACRWAAVAAIAACISIVLFLLFR